MDHKCWLDIACSCDCCGKQGCRDCLVLHPVDDEEDAPEWCDECFDKRDLEIERMDAVGTE